MTFLSSILSRYIYYVVLLYFTGIGRDVWRYGVSVCAHNPGVQAPALASPDALNSGAGASDSGNPEFSEQFSGAGRRFSAPPRSVAGAEQPYSARSHAVRSAGSLNGDHESVHATGAAQEGRLSAEHSGQKFDLSVNAAEGVVLDLRDPQGFEVSSEMKNGLLYKEICISAVNLREKSIRKVDLGSQTVWEAGPKDFCRCVTLISQLSPLYPQATAESNAFSGDSAGNFAGSHSDAANGSHQSSAGPSPNPEKRLLFIEVLNNSIYRVNYYSVLTYTDTNETKLQQISQKSYNLLLQRLASLPALDPEYLELLESEIIAEQAHLEADKVDGIKRPPVQPLSNAQTEQDEAELDAEVSRIMGGQPNEHSSAPRKLNRFTRLKYAHDFGEHAPGEEHYTPSERFNLGRSEPVFELESVEPVRTSPQPNNDSSHNQDQDQPDLSSNLFTHFVNSRDRSSTPVGLSNHQSMESMFKLHNIGANGRNLDHSLSGVWNNKKLDITDPGQNPHVYFEYEVNDGIPILSVRPRKKGLSTPINLIYESQNLVWSDPDSRMNELRAFSSYGEFRLVELVYQTKLVNLLASQQDPQSPPDYGEQYITYFRKDGNLWREVPIKEYEVAFKRIKSDIAHIGSVYLDISVVDNTELFFQKGELGQQFEAMTYFPLTGYTLNLVKDGELVVWKSDKKRCLAAVVIREFPAQASASPSPRISLGGTALNLGSEAGSGGSTHGRIRFLKLELVGSSKTNKRPKNLFFRRLDSSDPDFASNPAVANAQTENHAQNQPVQNELNYKYLEISESEFENAINGQLNVDLESFLPPDVADEGTNRPNEHIYNIYHDLPTSSIGYDDITTLTGPNTTFPKDLSKGGSEIDLDLLSKLMVKDALDQVLKNIGKAKQASADDQTTQVLDVDNIFRDAAKDFLPDFGLEQDQAAGKLNDDMSSHSDPAPVNAAQQHPQDPEQLSLEQLGERPEHRLNMRSIDKVQNWLNRSPNMPTNSLEAYEAADPLDLFGKTQLAFDFVGDLDHLQDGEQWEHSGLSRQQGSLEEFDLLEYEPFHLEQLDIAQYQFYDTNSHQGVEYRTYQPPEGIGFSSIAYNGAFIWESGEHEFCDFLRVFYFNHEPAMGLLRLIHEANFETRDVYFIRDDGAWKFVTSQVMMERFNAEADLTNPQPAH